MSCSDAARVSDDADPDPAVLRTALARLLDTDPARGIATALGILAREPRIKPSARLVIDPGNTVLRRWRQRVSAAVALVESPMLPTVFDEVYDELSDDPEFAADVLAVARVSDALDAARQARLQALTAA